MEKWQFFHACDIVGVAASSAIVDFAFFQRENVRTDFSSIGSLPGKERVTDAGRQLK